MVRYVLLVESGSIAGLMPRERLSPVMPRVRFVRTVEQVAIWANRWQTDVVVAGSNQFCLNLKRDVRTSRLPLLWCHSDHEDAFIRIEADAELSPPYQANRLNDAIRFALARKAQRTREGIVSELTVWVPSGIEELHVLCEVLPDWLRCQRLTPVQVRHVNQAVREIVANSIEWGHSYQRARHVRVECKADDEKVTILVRDTGPGFDRRNLPHAARPGDPITHLEVRAARNLREGGYGLLMASGLVDHLCFSATGNEGLLVKFLPSDSLQDAEVLSAFVS